MTIYSSRHRAVSSATELQRCAASPLYFMRSQLKLQTPRGEIAFNPTDEQEKFIQHVTEFQRTIYSHGRQVGSSSAMAAYALWHVLFKPNELALCVLPSVSMARFFLDLVMSLHASARAVPAKLTRRTMYEVSFDNGSKLIVASPTQSSFKGLPIGLLAVSDASYMRSEDFYNTLSNTLPICYSTGAKVVCHSGPGGNELFYDLLRDAVDGSTGWVDLVLP